MQHTRLGDRALELGINFFDAAQACGFGTSEERLAEALRNEIGNARDSVVLPGHAHCPGRSS